MSEINLTPEQFERLPYKGSTKKKGETFGDIIGLLESHGIAGYQWTRDQGHDQLMFPLKIKRGDVEFGFMVKMTVPRLMYGLRHGRWGPITQTYLEKESWRMFLWYLKSKIEAIEFGISDEIREFMYDIHYKLKDGRGEVGLGQLIIDNIDQLNKLTALEDNRQDRKVIDVEFKEKEDENP
jgi:hypothetical protein